MNFDFLNFNIDNAIDIYINNCTEGLELPVTYVPGLRDLRCNDFGVLGRGVWIVNILLSLG